MTRPPTFLEADRHRKIAAEVLELGETLFDALLEAASRSSAEGDEPIPEAELRSSAAEFFETLRFLLGLDDFPNQEAGTGQSREGD